MILKIGFSAEYEVLLRGLMTEGRWQLTHGRQMAVAIFSGWLASRRR